MIVSTLFRIQNPDGLFSTGGSLPRFKAKGKSWTNIGHVKNHLNVVMSDPEAAARYLNCTLVEIQVSETVNPIQPMNNFMQQEQIRKQGEKVARQQLYVQQKEKREQETLQELLRKYPR